MVIIPDRLSDLIAKGEVTERYYNPGELFREVHLVLTNDDRPQAEAVQKMVGGAKLYLHNVPTGSRFFIRTLGWQPVLMRSWTQRVVRLAEAVRPGLVRCHGAELNAHAAAAIRFKLHIPYVVSLHTNPAQSAVLSRGSFLQRIYEFWAHRLARRGLRAADLVLPVYRSIVPYLDKIGIKRYTVAYNALSPRLRRKETFDLGLPVRIVSVGRQIVGKNPENIIRAVARLPEVRLTLVGSGPLHEHLIAIAEQVGASQRCEFIESQTNQQICDILAGYDIFAAHCDYWGLPKAVMEPLLTGLPVVMNRRDDEPCDELEGLAMLVDNSPDGFERAFRDLIADKELRRRLGEDARSKAEKRFAPASCEAAYVEIYRAAMRTSLPMAPVK